MIDETVALRLCLLERPNPACSYCGGTGIRKSTIGYSGHGDIEEARRRLNEMVPCTCQPSGGHIPRFPTLREPCFYEEINYPEYKAHSVTCRCSGRTWVPVQHDVAERLLGIPYEVRFVGDYADVRLHENSQDYSSSGLTVLSRLLAALVLAVENE